jgi:hypothetical protein
MRAPRAWNFFGFSRNSLISWSSSTASSTPATSRKVIFGESTDMRLARDLPNDITFEPPPCIWLMMKSQNSRKITNGRTYVSTDNQPDPPLPFTSIGTLWARSWLIRFCSVLSG